MAIPDLNLVLGRVFHSVPVHTIREKKVCMDKTGILTGGRKIDSKRGGLALSDGCARQSQPASDADHDNDGEQRGSTVV